MADENYLEVYQVANATDGYTEYDTEVFNTSVTSANTWQELDLSGTIGAGYSYVILRVTCSGSYKVQAQAHGDSGTAGDAYRRGTQVSLQSGYVSTIHVDTDSGGSIDITCSNAAATVTIDVIAAFASNAAPTITNGTPTGATELPTVSVTFETADDVGVDSATIGLVLTDPSLATHNAIVNGVFQAGYAGTIVANASNGYDITLSTHPSFDAGLWEADADCDDLSGTPAVTENWSWTVVIPPVVTGVAPSGTITDTAADITFTTTDDTGVV